MADERRPSKQFKQVLIQVSRRNIDGSFSYDSSDFAPCQFDEPMGDYYESIDDGDDNGILTKLDRETVWHVLAFPYNKSSKETMIYPVSATDADHALAQFHSVMRGYLVTLVKRA